MDVDPAGTGRLIITRRPTATERFWAKVQKSDGCWLWTAYRNEKGYGRFDDGTITHQAHRLAWALTNGPVADGLLVCHKCDNPPCCNPDHLFVGTQKDNMQDAKQKGRRADGDRMWSRLHPERLARGARNGRYTKPERKARGERNGRNTKPEKTNRGEKVNTAKLTWELVRELRAAAAEGARTAELSSRFGVSMGNVRRIVTGKYWNEAYAPR